MFLVTRWRCGGGTTRKLERGLAWAPPHPPLPPHYSSKACEKRLLFHMEEVELGLDQKNHS